MNTLPFKQEIIDNKRIKEEEERIEKQKKDDSIRDRMDKIRQQLSQLPDDVKNMDISSLEESIRRIIRKELLS